MCPLPIVHNFLPYCMEYGSCLTYLSMAAEMDPLRYLQPYVWHFIGEIDIKSQFKDEYISVFWPT